MRSEKFIDNTTGVRIELRTLAQKSETIIHHTTPLPDSNLFDFNLASYTLPLFFTQMELASYIREDAAYQNLPESG